MNINPYVLGAITAIVFLAALYLLPKRIEGNKRSVISMLVAIVATLIIQFVADCVA